MIHVGVIGATGYAGAELIRILHGHPEVELSVITSRQYAGQPLSDIYPAFAGIIDLVCEAFDAESVAARAEVVFTALPHKLPMDIAPLLIDKGLRVVDLSADFRFRRVGVYETYYQPHSSPELSEKAVYGLSEIYRDDIAVANLIGNPGCYPTSILLPLIPLIREGVIDPGTIIADAKSGVSGAGRGLSLGSHFSEVNEGFKAYKVAAHRHNPEMDEVLSREAKGGVHITFTPHLLPMTRGMLSTIYAGLARSLTEREIREILWNFYQESPFVRICPAERTPNTLQVRGTNFCDIGCAVDTVAERVILISAIDNLVKGAAGQAVQNMNLMLGMREEAGLDGVPYPL